MDTNHGWTAQSQSAWIEDPGAVGQTFTKDQLPDPEQQRKGGVDPDLYRAGYGLWIEEDEPVDE
jgi:hypothetical protein